MPETNNKLETARRTFAAMAAVASGSSDGRIGRAFELVAREAFVGPGPWCINIYQRSVQTPGADPVFLYQNVVVALDTAKGINNGEPFLHAAWIGAVEPKPGEVITHVGAGAGYYSAILSVLVSPGGRVNAFEIEEELARQARHNLSPYDNVSLVQGDATQLPLPASDLIYVNAGVARPPIDWLKALLPQGRMIFPWRPSETAALATVISRGAAGFKVNPFMMSWFIPCVGAADAEQPDKSPDLREARSARSIWLVGDRAPDETAVAVYKDVWFSSAELPDDD
jgi:protein-L-isoaspartate(D-aspartate) O-methyltransferase